MHPPILAGSQTNVAPSEEEGRLVTPPQEEHVVADEEVPQGRATSLALVGPICPRAPSTDPASYQPLAMSHLPDGAGPSISSDRLSPASGTEDTTPRFTAEDKQKSRMAYSDDQGEQDHEMGEDPGRSPTPRPQEQQRVSSAASGLPSHHNFFQHRYATHDDIQRICETFRDLTLNIVQELVSELKQMNPRREGSRHYGADDEAEDNTPRRRLVKPRGKHPGIKRRSAAENALSVVVLPITFILTHILFQRRVREHMGTLIPKDSRLQDTIHPNELRAWNPLNGPCCTPDRFKLHLKGTARDDWNISASRVFTDHFLATHSDSYEDTWEIRQMVLDKTQAHIKTLVRLHREQFTDGDVVDQKKLAQRRRTRKTLVSYFCAVVADRSQVSSISALSSSQGHSPLLPTNAATATHVRRPGC